MPSRGNDPNDICDRCEGEKPLSDDDRNSILAIARQTLAYRTADSQSLIRFDDNDYSVPVQSAHRRLTVVATVSEFHHTWEALAPRDQARIIELLIERIDYRGKDGQISLTFRPSGIQTFTQETAV